MNRLRRICYLLGYVLIMGFFFACSGDPLEQEKPNSQTEKQDPEEKPDSTTKEPADSISDGISATIPGYELDGGSN